MGDVAGDLRAEWESREKRPPYRGARTYFVGVIRDNTGTRWTCETLTPRERHLHQESKFAQTCAEKALADGTWKDKPPPAPAWT